MSNGSPRPYPLIHAISLNLSALRVTPTPFAPFVRYAVLRYFFSSYEKVGGYKPPLDFAMDAGDSLSASNGSEFSSRTDDRTRAGCPGMHDDHPGW